MTVLDDTRWHPTPAGAESGPSDPTSVVGEEQAMDLDAAAEAVRRLLVSLGRNPGSEHLAGTPRRVAAAFAEVPRPEPSRLQGLLRSDACSRQEFFALTDSRRS
jgi:hypothetical protein